MTGEQKLRKENQALRNEVADLKEKLQKISELSEKTKQIERGTGEDLMVNGHAIDRLRENC